VNVTYTIDGVSHTVPAGTPMTVTDPQTGSTVSIAPGPVSYNSIGMGDLGGGANGPSGSTSRQVSIVNGQMTTTTTTNGVTTTTTSPAPPPGTVMTGSVPGDTQTMSIIDQNGVAHTIQVPVVSSGTVIITNNPDGTTNTLVTAPAPASP
jgi:hypothetical protein